MSQRYAGHDSIKRCGVWQMIVASLFVASICGCGRQSAASPASNALAPERAATHPEHIAQQSEAAFGSSQALNLPASSIPVDHSSTTPLTVPELVKLSGKPCETAPTGLKCLSEGFDFELSPDCAKSGYYAGVRNPAGASLLNGVPPHDTVERAVLPQGQLVCVQVVARPGKHPAYLFVTAIPAAKIEACPGCGKYGERKVAWRARRIPSSCVEIAAGRYEGGCAMGWVDSNDMELMGTLK